MKEFFKKKEIFFFCLMSIILITFMSNILDIDEMKEILDDFIEENIEKNIEKNIEDNIWESGILSYKVEELLREETFFEIDLGGIYGIWHKLLGKRAYDNLNYIKGKDGMIYYGSLVEVNDEVMTYAKRVKRAKEEAAKKGAKTLYVMLPSKIICGLSATEGEYLLNDKNAMQDDMLLSMQYMGLATIDLRENMKESGYPIDSLFYKTDNGWTTEAAYIAAVGIVQEISERYQDNWDPEGFYTNIDNYKLDHYKEVGIGNLAFNMGGTYIGRDDYSVIYPNFDTRLEWYNIKDNERTEGQFRETLITNENSINDLYLSSIVDRERIVNKKNPNGPKILCLRDRYFSPVASFLSLMCSQIDMVDIRSDKNDIDYERLIIEEDYDYLIIVGNPYNLDNNNYDYFKD